MQELLGAGPDKNPCPEEENVEAICHFFNTIGKQLDESPKSRRINDTYFIQMKELATNPQLAPRLRFMVRNVVDLRSNNWVPRREEVNKSFNCNMRYLHGTDMLSMDMLRLDCCMLIAKTGIHMSVGYIEKHFGYMCYMRSAHRNSYLQPFSLNFQFSVFIATNVQMYL
jgi:hypothetical protein